MIARLARRIVSLYRTLFRQPQLDRALDEELQAYLDHQIARRIAHGDSPADARRRVLADEGGIEPIKEQTRARRIGFGVATTAQDVRFGLRSMRRTPGFTLVACATLALGIGANVAMFTVMRSVLWRPLPYPDADRLAVIEVDVRGVRNASSSGWEVRRLRERARGLARIGTINGVNANLTVGEVMERVPAVSASDNLLQVLGVDPVLGRHLDLARDMGPTSVRAVLISHALWRRHFNADPAIVGRTIDVNNLAVEVAGVLPEDLRLYLTDTIGAEEHPDIWFPAEAPDDRTYRGYNIVARLAPGVTIEQARAEVDAVRDHFAREFPRDYENVQFRTSTLHDTVTSKATAGLTVLGLAVGFVLFVSCMNVANLMLARASGRSRELAVRRALGATRGRIVRQLLTESALLSLAGGVLGVVVANTGIGLLGWLRPTHLPRQSQVSMDGTVLLFSLALSLACGLLFGMLPALRFAASDAQALRAGRADSPSRRSRRLQRGLVIAEIALSIIPLVVAGLMLRTFVNLAHAPLGFNPARLVTAHVPLSFRLWPFRDVDRRVQLHLTMVEQLKGLPGVEDASAGGPLPFSPLQSQARFGRPGRDAASRPLATQQSIMPGYLRLTGTRVMQGREFTADDLTAKRPVAVISQHLADQLFPQGALGQRITNNSRQWPELEIVGVTENIRVRAVREEGQAHVFVPYHVFPIELDAVVRTVLPAGVVGPGIKAAIERLGTARAVHDIAPMRETVAASVAETRFTMLVLSGFAAASLLLAAIGLYGTLAYLSAQRAREFGVRLALGASTGQILRLVAGEGLALTAAGTVAGITGALGAAQLMRSLLYGVAPTDPGTIAAVIALVCAGALVASVRPAWVAARVDPVRALRAD